MQRTGSKFVRFPDNTTGKRVESIHDLRDYGFDVLTGEACGIGTRLLVDLSPRAVGIMEEFFSIGFDDRNNSWNHSGKEGWKSIMLPRSVISDLLVHVLAREGYTHIVKVDMVGAGWRAHYIEGFSEGSEAVFRAWKEAAENVYVTEDENGDRVYHFRVYYVTGNGRHGTRNRHYMSGRVD